MLILFLVVAALQLFPELLEGGRLVERELVELLVDAVHFLVRDRRGRALSLMLRPMAFLASRSSKGMVVRPV